MSTLLEQASLVMIPSGYKEDVVYSQIPTNGAGDLSFTRASNGTRINSAGLVEDVPWNLAQQSEMFADTYWNKVQATITANSTTAPNGTLTADTFAGNGVSDGHYIRANAPINSGTTYTLSIYAKKNTNNFLQITYALGFGTNEYANFDLNNGVTGTIGSGATATITNVGDGWYRCTITSTATSSTTSIAIAYALITSATSARVETNTLSTSVFIWGAQLNIGATAKPYFPTTDRLNVPRLTYQNGGGGCPSLLLEKQSTNVVTYSEQFDDAAWTKGNASITANATTSPDGTQNADKLVENTSTGEHYIIRVSATSTIGVAYTLSWYMKAGERNAVSLYNYSMNNLTAIFNANTGVATYVSGGTSYSVSMQNVGNGWYRCIATSNASDTNQDFALRLVQSGTTINYTGDGTSGIYIWGAQLEASSYPTSYIPTTSSSATRVADACFKTGISSLIGQTEGVIFVQIKKMVDGYNYFSISDGTTNNWIFVGQDADSPNKIRGYVKAGGVVYADIFSGVIANGTVKMAIAYKANDVVLYVNGSLIGSDTSVTIPSSLTDVSFNNLPSVSPSIIFSVDEFALFKTRLTNAELASLTTI